jgi:RNA polymerase sigma-70 factor (ECF subfamily)
VRVELVERARQGDNEAFAAIASASVDRCYALAYRILRDPERAQDAAQQALLSAWRDLPRLRDPERFDAWLYRLVVHICYVEARGERRRVARIRVLHDEPAATIDFASGIAAREELEEAFRELTPEHRAVVVLHHYQGYALTEIAATLGIPVGTARSRLHNAMKRLRAALEAGGSAATVPGERSA